MSISEVARQADGKLLVAGGFWGFEGKSAVSLARLRPDGTLDQAYRGAVNGTVNRILVLPDQRVLIGGAFTSPRNGVARLLPDGTLDSSFDPKSLFNAPIINFERLADGRIMVAGAFTAAGTSKQTCRRGHRSGRTRSPERLYNGTTAASRTPLRNSTGHTKWCPDRDVETVSATDERQSAVISGGPDRVGNRRDLLSQISRVPVPAPSRFPLSS